MLTQARKVYQKNPIVVWRPDLETIPGGFKLNQEGYKTGDVIPAGSNAHFDELTRIATIVPTAKLSEAVTGSAQAIKLPSGSGLAPGMFIVQEGETTSVKIVSAVSSNGYDTFTLDAPVTDLPKGTVFIKALETAINGSILFVTPNYPTYTEVVVQENATIDAVSLGTCYERRIPAVPKEFKALYPKITYLQSK